jgi:hypothetical protein
LTARRTREPKLTIGDRLLTALVGFVLVFLTMCVVWLLMLRIWFAATDTPLPFHWTWTVGLVAAVVGFMVGPEPMMDGIGAVWSAIAAVFRPHRY